MKKILILMMATMVAAGGVLGTVPAPCQAQVYVPAPAPVPRPVVVTPWVGANTPWVFYQGDWFMNGVLYYFFGNKLGWAPYYAYAPTYIARPAHWYAPRWNTWYKSHPVYWTNFQRQYPYWHGHKPGRVYDQAFYNRHHPGQGGGWHKGFQPGPPQSPPPGQRGHSEAMGSGHGPQHPGQPGSYQPGPGREIPPPR